MKINHQQLVLHLKNNLLPLYWVSGDEPLLLNESCDSVRQAAKAQGFSNREIFHVDAAFDWRRIIAEAKTLSLFAEKSILEIHLENKKISDAGKKMLQDYLINPAPDKLLLIISDKLDATALKSKWLQQLEKNAVIVQIWPVTQKELPAWIKTRLQHYGLSCDAAAIEVLAERYEGNLLALNQELEKLSLLYPQQKLTMEQIAEVVSDHARFDLFALADAVLTGNARRALRILRSLKDSATEPILLLWVLSYEIRHLLEIAEAVAAGQAMESVLKSRRVLPRKIPVLKQALRRYDRLFLRWILSQALHLDLILKGARSGNIWDELDCFLLLFFTPHR